MQRTELFTLIYGKMAITKDIRMPLLTPSQLNLVFFKFKTSIKPFHYIDINATTRVLTIEYEDKLYWIYDVANDSNGNFTIVDGYNFQCGSNPKHIQPSSFGEYYRINITDLTPSIFCTLCEFTIAAIIDTFNRTWLPLNVFIGQPQKLPKMDIDPPMLFFECYNGYNLVIVINEDLIVEFNQPRRNCHLTLDNKNNIIVRNSKCNQIQILPPQIYLNLKLYTGDIPALVLPLTDSFDWIFADFSINCIDNHCVLIPGGMIYVFRFRSRQFCLFATCSDQITVENTGTVIVDYMKITIPTSEILTDDYRVYCIDYKKPFLKKHIVNIARNLYYIYRTKPEWKPFAVNFLETNKKIHWSHIDEYPLKVI